MNTAAPVTYTAVCQRVGRWWEITVPELDEVTQARNLDDVPATVADLVALMTGTDPGQVQVEVKAHAGPGIAAGNGSLATAAGLAAAAAGIAWRVLRGLVTPAR